MLVTPDKSIGSPTSTVSFCSKNNEKALRTSVVEYADNARTHVCTGLFEQEMMKVVGEPQLSEVRMVREY